MGGLLDPLPCSSDGDCPSRGAPCGVEDEFPGRSSTGVAATPPPQNWGTLSTAISETPKQSAVAAKGCLGVPLGEGLLVIVRVHPQRPGLALPLGVWAASRFHFSGAEIGAGHRRLSWVWWKRGTHLRVGRWGQVPRIVRGRSRANSA